MMFIMGSKWAWSVAFLGLFPAGLIFGWFPPYLMGILLFGGACYLLSIIYIQITTPMPRSGADYVIPARVMGPFWGWIDSWCLVCAWTPIWGFAGWLTIRNIKLMVDILRISGLTTLSIPWVLDPLPSIYIGIPIIILGALFTCLPPRRYYKAMAVFGALAVLSLVICGIGAAGVNPSTFAANMKTLLGISPSDLTSTAINNGFDPNGIVGWASGAGLASYILFTITGFQGSASISGELRGDVKKSLTSSIVGSLTLFLIFNVAIVWWMAIQFGYNFTVGWSYLFWNARSAAPLSLPPINALLLTVAMPNLWPIWVLAGIAAIIGVWLIIPAEMLFVNRQVLAWGIDRMLPKSISEVHPRLRQPVRIVLIQLIVAILFYLLLVFAPSFNPVNLTAWNALLSLPWFVFPGICALLYPRRRPDLMKAVPWRKWLIPVGVLWLAIIIPFYAWAGLIGSFPPLTSGVSYGQYALSTGLLATGFAVLLGAVIYFAVKSYNLKRGIDLRQVYKTIPPE